MTPFDREGGHLPDDLDFDEIADLRPDKRSEMTTKKALGLLPQTIIKKNGDSQSQFATVRCVTPDGVLIDGDCGLAVLTFDEMKAWEVA